MRERRQPRPLDPASLERMALRYVERFATTRGRLAAYLERKLRERGWAGDAPPAPLAIVARFAENGYVDDRGYAEAKAASMARRGLGARRVEDRLRSDKVDDADRQSIAEDVAARAETAALAYARRRRIGRFGHEPVDRPTREKQVAAMIRAGHDVHLARRIAAEPPPAAGDDLD